MIHSPRKAASLGRWNRMAGDDPCTLSPAASRILAPRATLILSRPPPSTPLRRHRRLSHARRDAGHAAARLSPLRYHLQLHRAVLLPLPPARNRSPPPFINTALGAHQRRRGRRTRCIIIFSTLARKTQYQTLPASAPSALQAWPQMGSLKIC